MSLLRLLTAGKSLVGLKDSGNRYSLPSQGALPKFRSKQNPFRATALPEKADVKPPGTLREEPAFLGGSNRPEEIQESQLRSGKIDMKAASMAPPAQEEHSEEKSSAANATQGGRNGVRLAALRLWRRARFTKREAPRLGKPLVQAELSLNSIKVVRNDLSESDLEVVGAERAAVPQCRAADGESARKAPAGEQALERMASRLFGMGKT